MEQWVEEKEKLLGKKGNLGFSANLGVKKKNKVQFGEGNQGNQDHTRG